MQKPQHRRTKLNQAADILKALLVSQSQKAARLKVEYEQAEAVAERTRSVLRQLGQTSLPGFDAATQVADLVVVKTEAPYLHPSTSSGISLGEEEGAGDLEPPAICKWSSTPHPHRRLPGNDMECVEEKPWLRR